MAPEDHRGGREWLINTTRAFMRGKALCAAVRLGIPDALADRIMNLDELASTTASNPESLHRLLRALASIGVVEEIEPDCFKLTAFGSPLKRNAPNSAWASVVFWTDLISDFWTYLPECIRAGDGTVAAEAMERLGIKSRWSMEPEAQALFYEVFAEPTADDMAPFVAAFDFTRFPVVADLGGAGGGLISAVLTANPQACGILADRLEAVERASARLEAAGLAHRCQLVVSDLLQSVPHGAELYVLKNVLHGYDDRSAVQILQNCHSAMQLGGRLLIIETVLPDTVDSADHRVEKMLMGDLNMLLVTGGRDRSAYEWRELLASAALEMQSTASVDGSSSSIIEATQSTS